jgi:hypothetical protein
MDFGADRNERLRSQTYRMPAGFAAQDIHIGTINDIVNETTKDALVIRQQQLTFRANPNRADARLVNVRVCYDAGGPREPDAGRYQGTLLVSAAGLQPSPLSLAITVRDDAWWKPILALIFGLLVGIVARAIGDLQQAPTTIGKSFWQYLFRLRILVALGFGVAAGIGAYIRLVEGNETFDGSFSAVWPLVGATFGATVAGKTITDILKSPSDEDRDKGLAPRQSQ